jgi:hypothetical protein
MDTAQKHIYSNYIMTVQNNIYVLWINLYKLSKL